MWGVTSEETPESKSGVTSKQTSVMTIEAMSIDIRDDARSDMRGDAKSDINSDIKK